MKRILDFIRRTFGVTTENVTPSQKNDTENVQAQEVTEDWREKLLREHTERIAALKKEYEELDEQSPDYAYELECISDRLLFEFCDYDVRSMHGYDYSPYTNAKVEPHDYANDFNPFHLFSRS